jgi:hypothetical protein
VRFKLVEDFPDRTPPLVLSAAMADKAVTDEVDGPVMADQAAAVLVDTLDRVVLAHITTSTRKQEAVEAAAAAERSTALRVL